MTILPFPASNPTRQLAGNPGGGLKLPAFPPIAPATTEGSPVASPPSIADFAAPPTDAGTPFAPSAGSTRPSPPPPRPETRAQPPEEDADRPDFTDDDLRVAFGPIVEHAVRRAVYAQENGIDTYLEPMLRATIRRALAEYTPASRPFQPPGAWDRFIWHLQALFSSRTYEEILFEKTRRFQVEEVYLLDSASLALVSYASCDPARHAATRRVSGTVNRLALQLRDDKGTIRPAFTMADGRSVISKVGHHVVLMAIVRGRPGELVLADLDFALRRVEDHFRSQFLIQGSELLYPLQPFLEDCLLIQSPASAA